MDLSKIIENAIIQTKRCKQEQIIYMDRYNEFGFIRNYKGCLSDWNGEIEIARTCLHIENNQMFVKVIHTNLDFSETVSVHKSNSVNF